MFFIARSTVTIRKLQDGSNSRGESTMAKKLCLLFAGMLAALVLTSPVKAADDKIAVLSPLGQPPPITRVPQALRIGNLEGKTIYIVDFGFTASASVDKWR